MTRPTRAVVRQHVNSTTGDIDPDFVHEVAWTYPRFSHSVCLTGSVLCTNIGGAWAVKHELLKRRGRLGDRCPHPTKILILKEDNSPNTYSTLVTRAKPGSREHALNVMGKFRTSLETNPLALEMEPPFSVRIVPLKPELAGKRLRNMITGKSWALTAAEQLKDQRRLERIRKLERPAVGTRK